MKILLATLLLSSCCLAQTISPTVGHAAPELALQRMMQGTEGVAPTLAALRGRPVVLEFWATWCGGCVLAIPHLNALADQFKGRVTFVSVSDEDAGVVEAFLKRRPIQGLVGIDRDGATFKIYGVEARPQTFLIDAAGLLLGPVISGELNEELLTKLVAGEPLGSAVKEAKQLAPVMERQLAAPTPLLQCILRPAAAAAVSGNAPGAYIAAEGGRREEYGVSVQRLLSEKLAVRPDRIVGPEWTETARFDVSTVVPQGRGSEERDRLVVEMMTMTFELKSHREMRPVSVYVLRALPESAAKMRVSSARPGPGFRPEPGHVTGVGSSVLDLVRRLPMDSPMLAPSERVEVLDETGLSGVYDFDLTWKAGDVSSLEAGLREQLGLKLTRETREREFLVIDSAVEPTTW